MTTTETIALVALITTMWGFFIGYKTSIIIAKQREAKWWAEMTYEDCHVTKEETYGWWGITTPPLEKIQLCPRCFRFRALHEQLLRVNEIIMNAPVDNWTKDVILYEVNKIKHE